MDIVQLIGAHFRPNVHKLIVNKNQIYTGMCGVDSEGTSHFKFFLENF